MKIQNSKFKIQNSEKGFTIIELLVVTMIVVIVSGVVANSFFSSLKGGVKTTITNIAKENGDQAMSTMENMIKNAIEITPACPYGTGFSAQTSITVTNRTRIIPTPPIPTPGVYYTTTTFTCPATPATQIGIQIIPQAPTPTVSQFLTAASVSITNCSFSCSKQKGAPAVLKINFTVIQSNPSATYRPEEQVSIPFETSVVLRNISAD